MDGGCCYCCNIWSTKVSSVIRFEPFLRESFVEINPPPSRYAKGSYFELCVCRIMPRVWFSLIKRVTPSI